MNLSTQDVPGLPGYKVHFIDNEPCALQWPAGQPAPGINGKCMQWVQTATGKRYTFEPDSTRCYDNGIYSIELRRA